MTAPEGPLVIGVDSSTQSTKALVVDSATGRVVAQGQAPHTVSTGEGRESDPEEWWQALKAAVGLCGRPALEAAAISVAGQQHGLVTLDGGEIRYDPRCCGTTCVPRRSAIVWWMSWVAPRRGPNGSAVCPPRPSPSPNGPG